LNIDIFNSFAKLASHHRFVCLANVLKCAGEMSRICLSADMKNVAAYGDVQRQGLAMWRYSVIRQPEPLLSKVNEDEIIFYSWAFFRQPDM
jgi:hypothetical protein